MPLRLQEKRRSAEVEDEGEPEFPWAQMCILGLCRVCEPIAFMSIFPYVYHMVASFHVTEDDDKIALWVGAVTSAFTFAEFSTGVLWGRMSDSIGRKPVLLLGLAGTAISMLVFGFSSSLPMALTARALGGFLNGNIGVLQTTVAELVKDKRHQARAYSLMPSVWSLGSVIGPAMGGALARPRASLRQNPSSSSMFDRYPFLLPNLACVVVLIIGITVGTLFLEETHADKRMNRDRGRELGQWLIRRFSRTDSASNAGRDVEGLLINRDPPPGYRSTESSPRLTSVQAPPKPVPCLRRQQKGAGQPTFTPNVLFVIAGYGFLAYHSVSFDQLMPIFLSTPVSGVKPALPFSFVGGLGLTAKTVGFMMAVQGVYSLFAQLWLFPFLVRCIGTLRAYRVVLYVWPLIYMLVPYLILLPAWLQTPAVYASLIGKITLHVIAFPTNAILLANAAPSNAVLGTINGIAASTASLSRALGPTFTGYLHSMGLNLGCSGLAWWACGIVCAIGAIESLWIREEEVGDRDYSHSEKVSSDHDCEACDSECASPVFLTRTESKEQLRLLLPSRQDHHHHQSSMTTTAPTDLADLEDILDLELPAPRTPPPESVSSR